MKFKVIILNLLSFSLAIMLPLWFFSGYEVLRENKINNKWAKKLNNQKIQALELGY